MDGFLHRQCNSCLLFVHRLMLYGRGCDELYFKMLLIPSPPSFPFSHFIYTPRHTPTHTYTRTHTHTDCIYINTATRTNFYINTVNLGIFRSPMMHSWKLSNDLHGTQCVKLSGTHFDGVTSARTTLKVNDLSGYVV